MFGLPDVSSRLIFIMFLSILRVSWDPTLADCARNSSSWLRETREHYEFKLYGPEKSHSFKVKLIPGQKIIHMVYLEKIINKFQVFLF